MDLRDVDLNLLVAFDALLSKRNVTAAARELSVGQSAMSSSLSRLRSLLDDPVLIRQGRAMVPSPLAESLIDPIHEALNDFRAVLQEPPRFNPREDRRTFTVMASEYAALAVLQPLLITLRQAAPHVELRIHPVSASFVDDLTTDAVDLVIVPSQVGPRDPSLSRRELYRDPFVVAVDVANPLVGESISQAQLSSLPYLAGSSGHFDTLVESQLDQLGVERRLEVTTGFGIAPFLLRDTLLVTLLPESLARTIAEGARLKILPSPVSLTPITEAMVWTSRNDDDPGHAWLRDQLADVAERRMSSVAGVNT